MDLSLIEEYKFKTLLNTFIYNINISAIIYINIKDEVTHINP